MLAAEASSNFTHLTERLWVRAAVVVIVSSGTSTCRTGNLRHVANVGNLPSKNPGGDNNVPKFPTPDPREGHLGDIALLIHFAQKLGGTGSTGPFLVENQ